MRFRLDANQLGDVAGVAIADAIRVNTTLKELQSVASDRAEADMFSVLLNIHINGFLALAPISICVLVDGLLMNSW